MQCNCKICHLMLNSHRKGSFSVNHVISGVSCGGTGPVETNGASQNIDSQDIVQKNLSAGVLMDGFLLLADGTKLNGQLSGCSSPTAGWLTVNTGVVGFQQMLTDPVYRNVLLAFTYPEVGNTGEAASFSESDTVQPRGVIVRELCSFPSHYRAGGGLSEMLSRAEVPCLSGVDTRGLAVLLRRNGEMPAMIASADHDESDLLRRLRDTGRPRWAADGEGGTERKMGGECGPEVAVIDLGMRNSFAGQLCRCCRPRIFSCDALPETVMEQEPDAVVVTDGPAVGPPPEESLELLKSIIGRVPLLACGLGNIALGMAMGCGIDFLRRGHHGANYPVRDVQSGAIETTFQRHSVVLDRQSAEQCEHLDVSRINVNDGSVEGVRTGDGLAIGYQHLLPLHGRDGVNHHLSEFMESL